MEYSINSAIKEVTGKSGEELYSSWAQELSNQYKKRVHFIHLNHTNKVLQDNSDAFKYVVNKGFSIAKENQSFKI